MKIVNEALYQFIRDRLTVSELEGIHSKMEINKVKWARLMRGQDEWTAKEVSFMAGYLNIHWYYDFCLPLQVGERITLAESNRLSQIHGQVMQPVDVAA